MLIWDVNVDNIVILKLVKRKNNSKYLTGYFDISKMNGYAKTFKVEDKINQLMSFHMMKHY